MPFPRTPFSLLLCEEATATPPECSQPPERKIETEEGERETNRERERRVESDIFPAGSLAETTPLVCGQPSSSLISKNWRNARPLILCNIAPLRREGKAQPTIGHIHSHTEREFPARVLPDGRENQVGFVAETRILRHSLRGLGGPVAARVFISTW